MGGGGRTETEHGADKEGGPPGREDGAEGLLVWWAEEPVASDKGSPNNCWRRAMVRTARKYGTWYPSGHMAPYRTNKQR